MEETVRSLLQSQTAVDTVDIMKAYKVNCLAPVCRFRTVPASCKKTKKGLVLR